jgi:predicted nuclease of predicted toxin-antitoxin system
MTVRLLVNENFPAPSVACLRVEGYDVVSVAESYAGMEDASVLSLAVREKRWLVTFDRDYGELIFARGLPPPPAVILLRVPSYRPADPATWIMRCARPSWRARIETIRSRPLIAGSAK